MKHALLLLSLLSLFMPSCSKERQEQRCIEKGYYQPKEITNYNDAFFDLTARYNQYDNSSLINIDMDSILPDGNVDEQKGSLYLPIGHRFLYLGVDFQEQFYEGSCNTDQVFYKQERGDGILNDTLYWYTEDGTHTVPINIKAAIPPADTIIFPAPSGTMYYWEGEALEANETVNLRITTYVDDSTTWHFDYSTDLIGATGIYIPGHDLYDLTGFFSWVSMSRHRNYYIGQPQIPYWSGHINLSYYHEDVVLGVW